MPGTVTNTPPPTSIVPKTSLRTPRKPPKKPKKRRNKSEREEVFYEIRDIIQEEVRRGKLFYKIDWADDPTTGEAYPPSWEPAEYATADAIIEWEARKSGAVASPDPFVPKTVVAVGDDSSEKAPASSERPRTDSNSGEGDYCPNQKGKEKLATGQQSVAQVPDSQVSERSSKAGYKIAVEITPHPDLVPAEYLAIDLSQSETQSQPTSVIHDTSQASQHFTPEPQDHSTVLRSQSTIPDSQGFSESLPSQLLLAQGIFALEPDLQGIAARQGEEPRESGASTDEISGSQADCPTTVSCFSLSNNTNQQSSQRIPSRQLDSQAHPIQNPSDGLQGDATSSDESTSIAPALVARAGRPITEPSPYLIQPSLNSPRSISSTSRVPDILLPESQKLKEHVGPGLVPFSSIPSLSPAKASSSATQGTPAVTSASPSPSAQLVQPLSSQPQDIQTESDDSIGARRAEAEFSHLPNLLLSQPTQTGPPTESASQDSSISQPLSESNGNRRRPIPTSRLHATEILLRCIEDEFSTAPPSLEKASTVTGKYGRASSTESSPVRYFSDFESLRRQGTCAAVSSIPGVGNMEASQSQEPSGRSALFVEAQPDRPEFESTSDSGRLQNPFSGQSLISPSTVLPLGDNESLATIEGLGEHPAADLLMSATLDFNTALPTSDIPELSAVEQLKRAISLSPMPEPSLEIGQENATVTPAELSTQYVLGGPPTTAELTGSHINVHDLTSSVLPGIESDFPESTGEGGGEENAEMESPIAAYIRPQALVNEYIITLPMATNTRHFYLAAILRHKETMTAFGELFQSQSDKLPDNELVEKLDRAFEELYDLCDLPAYADSLPTMSPADMRKHATGTNSKFSFVFELLDQIRTTNIRVGIVSKPGRVFQYLDAILSSSDFCYSLFSLESHETASNSQEEGVHVILTSSDEAISKIPDVDVLINFDHTTRDIKVNSTVYVLTLVVACTIEHVDLKLIGSMDPMERRNAMNYATVVARKFLDDTDGDVPRPHEVAQLFADFVNDPDDGVIWEPRELPDVVFDYWLGTQPSARMSQDDPFKYADGLVHRSGRKRRLDDGVDNSTPKRIKRSEELALQPPPQLSDLLKGTLQRFMTPTQEFEPILEVSVLQLESLAAKNFELEEQVRAKSSHQEILESLCKRQEIQLKSHERTTKKIAARFYDALSDRGTFEKEHVKAVKQAEAAEKRAEETKTQVTALKEKITSLESKLTSANAALADSTNPEIAHLGEMAKELEEARAKIQSLEKKLAAVQNENEYSRQAYQDASNRHSELSTENKGLAKQVADLATRANENILQIHKIQAENERREDGRIIDELRAINADRERELERVREELRVLRNGRRETRQASVPRSPRMGVLSPRNGRGGAGGGTAGSRGTSPAAEGTSVAGMSFLSPGQSNGRWDHLHNY